MNQDARSYDFLRLILDSITEHLVVIDEDGNIQFVNRSWLEFAGSNAYAAGEDWRGVNYLEECDKASHARTFPIGQGFSTLISRHRGDTAGYSPCGSIPRGVRSMMKVSGPSFSQETRIWAPNSTRSHPE